MNQENVLRQGGGPKAIAPREALILLLICNHPDLAVEQAEELAALEFANADLDWLIHRQLYAKKIDVLQTLRPNLASTTLTPANQGQPAVGVRGIQWLNAAAFAAPARFTYGNAARTLPGVLGPGLVNFDTMLSKNFRYGERFRLQIRWEMFNAFNTPYFGLPIQDLGAGGFGVISSAGNRRIMQFGAKLYL